MMRSSVFFWIAAIAISTSTVLVGGLVAADELFDLRPSVPLSEEDTELVLAERAESRADAGQSNPRPRATVPPRRPQDGPRVGPNAPRPADQFSLGDSAFAGGEERWSLAYTRFASIPNMLGNFYGQGLGLVAFDGRLAFADLPVAGGCGRTQVAENNKALTQDRVYFLYNHYSNALVADASDFIVGPDRRVFAVDRYTIGAEKSFLDHLWSVEVRMPFAGQMDFLTPNFSVGGGEVGNLAVFFKRMLYEADGGSIVAGLGVDVPTGSPAQGHVNLTEYTVHNDAVHLLPFLGFLYAPGDLVFVHGFAQLDVPTNGQRVRTRDVFFGPSDAGEFTEQTLGYLDLSAGCWLLRNPDAPLLTGLAGLAELHYTSTLCDGDFLMDMGVPMTLLLFVPPADRVDLLDFTVGLHAELRNNTMLRVAGAFPLRTGSNRTFDAELQVQLERRF